MSVDGVDFVYRQLGPDGGVPMVLLNHLAAVLDNWDPRVVDGLAAQRRVITFDNRGVGASGGSTPDTIEAMAHDAVAFIRALGLDQVDLLGLSMGGFIAQVIAQKEPQLVRKIILAGTGPAGGDGIDKVTALTLQDMARGALTFQDPKQFLFFTRTANGRRAGREFLQRLKERTQDRDKAISIRAFRAQLKAIHRWGRQTAGRPLDHPPPGTGGERRERPDGAQQRTPSTWPNAYPTANSYRSTPTPDTAGSSSTTSSSFARRSNSSRPSTGVEELVTGSRRRISVGHAAGRGSAGLARDRGSCASSLSAQWLAQPVGCGQQQRLEGVDRGPPCRVAATKPTKGFSRVSATRSKRCCHRDCRLLAGHSPNKIYKPEA